MNPSSSANGNGDASSLAYRPYTRKTHSRGTSVASVTNVASSSTAAGGSSHNTPPNGSGIQPGPARSSAAPPLRPLANANAASSSSFSSVIATQGTPPPLRRISEIRNKPSAVAASSPLASSASGVNGNGKGKAPQQAASSSSSSAVVSNRIPGKEAREAKTATSALRSSGGGGGHTARSSSGSLSGMLHPSASKSSHTSIANYNGSRPESASSSGSSTPYPLSLPATQMHMGASPSSLYTALAKDPIPIPTGPALAQASAASNVGNGAHGGIASSRGGYGQEYSVSMQDSSRSGFYAGHSTSTDPSAAGGRMTSYRSGFQARGVYRILTDDFQSARRKHRATDERRKIELSEDRLTRRLEKLVVVHANAKENVRREKMAEKLSAADVAADGGGGGIGSKIVSMDSASGLSLSVRDVAGGMWSTLRTRAVQLASSLEDPERVYIRNKEQEIVHWCSDREAKKCPICATPFSMAVRKHHCRLCGRVVCASPHLTRFGKIGKEAQGAAMGSGEAAQAKEIHEKQDEAETENRLKCSGLVLADPKTNHISSYFISSQKEDYEEKMAGSSNATSARRNGETSAPGEIHIRICRECRDIVCRRQYMSDQGGRVPTYLKLYDALLRLQREIEESLPEFQEMVLGLQKHDASATLGFESGQQQAGSPDSQGQGANSSQATTRMMIGLQKDAAAARKQLLANFANYDALARRIRSLPVEDADDSPFAAMSGSQRAMDSTDRAQERLQQAVWTRANLFLQQNMFPLQSLPKFGAKKDGESTPSSTGSTPVLGGAAVLSNVNDSASSKARSPSSPASLSALKQQLSVLLEQEQLVSSYIESANRERKFDDAKSLRGSLVELQKEIAEIRRAMTMLK